MTSLYRILPEEMDDIVTSLGQPRYRADQLLHALYHEFPKTISDIHQIPSVMQNALAKAGYTYTKKNVSTTHYIQHHIRKTYR